MKLQVPALAIVVVAAVSCSAPKPPDDEDYVTMIARAREEKNAFFRTSNESPVPATRREALLPLDYYPVDPKYNVPAVLHPTDDTAVIHIPTSAGTQDPFRKVGTLEFTVVGQTLKLTAYAPAASRTLDRLFVPFKDLTSERDTYQGGRYIDLDRTATGIYQIDFNVAYTPTCYFDPQYICPLPPRENHLPIAIEAGEKIKKEGKA